MKKMTTKFVLMVTVLTVLTTACTKNSYPDGTTDNLSNEVILKWNEVTYEALGGTSIQHSLMAACAYAMVHAAMHDAVNATLPHYETFAYHQKVEGANPEVAAASAAHHVLKSAFPATANYVDSVFENYIASFSNSASKTKGIELGINVSNALLALGYNSKAAINPIAQPLPATKPGDYKLVPPFEFIFAPFWEDSKLFSLSSKDQFRSIPPPAINSDAYTAAFNEVKELGALESKTRTADQTFFAKYWYEFSESGWNRIARIASKNTGAGLFTTARLFALLNFAVADSYTAGWDSKIYYNLWRPCTAIQEAEHDGNENTIADKNWQPCEATPPIQDYPSTHSALGNAAATVLASFFGDNTSFTMISPTGVPAGTPRSFNSFSQAAKENAESRVMAGIHFRFACDAGLELGQKIGSWTVQKHLKPLK
jgi:hypothetical protein